MEPEPQASSESGADIKITLDPAPPSGGGLYCPHCKSKNLQTIVETDTKGEGGGYGAGKGCLGYLLLGPLGLLCGACGSKAKITTTNKTFFMCMGCGNKFREANEFAEEKSKESIFSIIVALVAFAVAILGMDAGEIWMILGGFAVSALFVFGTIEFKKESEDIKANQYAAKVYQKK